MFVIRKKGGGNKFTFISILMIIAVILVFKLVSPRREAEYPDTVRYDGLRYTYAETVKSSPVMYVRKRNTCEEGYMILALRGVDSSKEIYIYEGFMRYRRYEAIKDEQ